MNYLATCCTAPMSVQLSAEDLKAVVNRECALPFEVANLFWAHIDPAISAGLAYTFEEINFSGSFSEGQRLRAAAYKVTEKPQTLTDEDFELLLRVGKDTFQNDGLVLGQIGTKLFKDGDVEGAFDWLMQAVQTIRRNDNKIFRVQLDSPLADYLELLSKACLISRERTVEQLKQHYDRVKPKTGHSLAGKEWNLSLCWSKLGRLDLAIEHANRAIEIAETVPTRKGEFGWWTHHVGDLLASAGKQSQAIEKFREAAAREPSDFRHPWALAQEYRRLRDTDRMFEALNEALRLNPNDGDIIGFKATALREFDPGSAEVLPLARRWAQRKPKDGSARFFLSDELAKAGDVEGAIEEARAAASCEPEIAWRHHHLADLLIRKSQWGQALAAIDQAILRDPKRAVHHYLRAEILLKMGKLDEARTSSEEATRCEDTVPWHFHLLGHVCASLGDHANAAQAFEKAADLEPSNHQHHFRLAQEYRSLGDRERTLAAQQRTLSVLDEALRLKPNDGDLIGFKATSLRDFDPENPEILVLARRWVERRPRDGSARFFLSDVLAKAGEVDGAIEEARAAIGCNPKIAWRHHHLADLLARKSQWEQALAAIDEAILLEPKRSAHHYVRGDILLKIEKLEEAGSAAEKATLCEDTVPWHFHLLGHVRASLRDHAGAAQAFEKAAAMEPGNYRHHFRLAQEYFALRDRERTLEALAKAIQLMPNDPSIIEFRTTALREFGSGIAQTVPVAGG